MSHEDYINYLKDQHDRWLEQQFSALLDKDDDWECGVSEDHVWKDGDYECRRCGADLSEWNEEEEK